MELFGIISFCIIVIATISITIGIVKQQLRQSNQDLQQGEKIDTIIRDNSNISDDEWSSWLQKRRNKQK